MQDKSETLKERLARLKREATAGEDHASALVFAAFEVAASIMADERGFEACLIMALDRPLEAE